MYHRDHYSHQQPTLCRLPQGHSPTATCISEGLEAHPATPESLLSSKEQKAFLSRFLIRFKCSVKISAQHLYLQIPKFQCVSVQFLLTDWLWVCAWRLDALLSVLHDLAQFSFAARQLKGTTAFTICCMFSRANFIQTNSDSVQSRRWVLVNTLGTLAATRGCARRKIPARNVQLNHMHIVSKYHMNTAKRKFEFK